jgi:two-component system, sensor histidine kinase and response regulator
MAPERYFDPSVMERLLGGNRDMMVKHAGRFLDAGRGALAEIDAALDGDKLEQLRDLGHRTRSAALAVGAQEIAALCLRLEHLPGDVAAAGPVVAELHAAFAATASRMRDAGLA